MRAIAPAVSGFHGLAFLRGGMMAAAPRAALASWHLRVSKAPSAVTLDLLIGRDLVQKFRQHGRVAHVAGGELRRPDFQRLLVDRDVDLAPDSLCQRSCPLLYFSSISQVGGIGR